MVAWPHLLVQLKENGYPKNILGSRHAVSRGDCEDPNDQQSAGQIERLPTSRLLTVRKVQ
jgi:hypothetical protein